VSNLRVTLVKSGIGYKPAARATLVALGLRRLGQSVDHADSPVLRGMVTKVRHLVEVKVVE
jgi:large subunit ribosomal protein L30